MPFLLILGILMACLLGPHHAAVAQGAAPVKLDRSALQPTFTDDFRHFTASASGVADDRPAWCTTFFNGDRTLSNNHEVEWYADPGTNGPFRVSNGSFEITAAPKAGLPQGLTHQSGLITSQRLFSQRYGYFEMRAQLPLGAGLWPAFWLLPADGSWPPEIDVMEMLGTPPNTYYVSVHARPDGQHVDETTAVAAPDLTAGFHVFGVSWRPDHIRFYLDNVLVHETATPSDMNRPMYLLANLAVGGVGSWPGPAAADLSGVLRISWIKAWQFKDLGGASRSR